MQKAVRRLTSIQRNKCDISCTLYIGTKFITPSYILSYLILKEFPPGRYFSYVIHFKFARSREAKLLAQDHTANKWQHWHLYPVSHSQIPRPSSRKSTTSQNNQTHGKFMIDHRNHNCGELKKYTSVCFVVLFKAQEVQSRPKWYLL